MSITSGFFNSVDGDRTYNARDMSMYFRGLISDGVFENVDGKLQVTAGSGMAVNVASGRAVIDCQWVNNDATETLAIDPAEVGKKRYDVIALRLDMTESGRAISLVVKKGTAAATNPTVPTRTWTENIKELFLARVTINSNTTAISQALISDLRGTAYCGYVTGLIDQVDTAQLFAQYKTACETYYEEMTTKFDAYMLQQQQAFNSWFSTLTEQLHVDTSIVKYQYSATINDASGYIDNITMPISEYTEGDILFLHIGGVLLVEGTEFIITKVGAEYIISFPNRLKAGSNGIPIAIIVIKSVIGEGILSNEIDLINGEVI